uniref:Uncharacterized protein n=1 Tax=Romanomermis culicivorax TaxID=13658 RepID=A0A915L2P6_ROMCU
MISTVKKIREENVNLPDANASTDILPIFCFSFFFLTPLLGFKATASKFKVKLIMIGNNSFLFNK